MTKTMYEKINSFMNESMSDCSHDKLHVYRVLNNCLEIMNDYPTASQDIVIASALLHDIGRPFEYQDKTINHAILGAKIANDFLLANNWSKEDAMKVRNCIEKHRFRSNNEPSTIEEKILFDADKLDDVGAIGIARTLLYAGEHGKPLYTTNEEFINDDYESADALDSFCKEYNFKLKKLYDKFYTKKAKEISKKREIIACQYYEELMKELNISNIKDKLTFEGGKDE